MGTWILENFDRHPEDDVFTHSAGGVSLFDWSNKNLGNIIVFGPFESHTVLNYTGGVGKVSGIYYSLVFQLPKWKFRVVKYDENIDVSPMHQQYYALTIQQKEQLEVRIKAGLADVARAIGDYELIAHDERKYQEFKDYFQHKDEHSLRSVFIDQVDVHTGDVGMRTIVQRWPTLIHDFLRLDENDSDTDKVKDRLKVSKAEAIVLVTKNKLYMEWKKLFISEVEERLARISSLSQARKKSIEEYREWLKPHVTRFKLIKQAFESPGSRMASVSNPYVAGGQALSRAEVTLWIWKYLEPPGLRRPSPDVMPRNLLDPYDNFVKEELIWNRKYGLINKFPWLTEEWVDKKAEEIKKSQLMDLWVHYYAFIELKYARNDTRTADGAMIEDGDFSLSAVLLSQNALLAKLIELKAKEEEMERYINDLLGIPQPDIGKAPKIREKKKVSTGLKFFKHGPYERDFENRVTKFYLKYMAGNYYVPIVGFIKKRFGIGGF